MQRWILATRNQSTSRQYSTYQKQFREFCQRHSRASVPATPATVAMFLRALLKKHLARNTIKAARAAVSDLHRQEDFKTPTLHPLVKQAMQCIGLLTPPPVPAKAFDLEMFREMLTRYRPNSTLDTRDMFLVLLTHLAMLRSEETVTLGEKDVWVENFEGQDVLFVFIEKSKTDQERVGHTRVISGASDPLVCPLAWYLRYLRSRRRGATFFATNAGKPLSSKTVSSILKRWLVKAGLTPVGFSSHSLRRGAATAAAAAGVARRLLMRHGNWKSSAVDIYITDTMDARLSVTQAILS